MVYECYLKEEWEKLKEANPDIQMPGTGAKSSTAIELDSNKSNLDEEDQKPFDMAKKEEEFPAGLQRFAVKVTRDDDQEKLKAHEEEFKILGRLDHPNVVKGIEIFRDDFKNEVCQVMQFVKGSELLDEIAKMGKYTEADA